MTTQESVGAQLARDMVDGVLKQSATQARVVAQEEEAKIDSETMKKITDKEIKMATDSEFALQEEARMAAADKMRRNRERASQQPEPTPEPEKKGGWAIVNGQIIKDPDGTMTLNEALIVHRAENPGSKLGWSVIGGKAVKVPDGDMTLSEALQVAAQEHREEGDPELKALVKQLAQKDLDAKDAVMKSIVDGNKAIIERLTHPVNAGSPPAAGVKTKIYTPDPKSPTGYKESTFEPGDTVFVPPPPPQGDRGVNVAELTENNRHTEELARIKETADHHGKIAESLAKGVESIATVGAQLASGGKVAPAPAQSALEYEKCTCGFNIPHKPGALTFNCPQCGRNYHEDSPEGIAAAAKVKADRAGAAPAPPAPPAEAPAEQPAAEAT